MWIAIIVGVVVLAVAVVAIAVARRPREAGQFTCPKCRSRLNWKFDDHDMSKTEWFCKSCGYKRTEDKGEASHYEVRP